jgi:nucleotide-binding universal stress UspA family protein
MTQLSRIAVGVDGSEGADHALRWATDLALLLGAEVIVVHAIHGSRVRASCPAPLPSPVPPLPDQLPPALAATGPSWAPSTVARGTPPCTSASRWRRNPYSE